MNPSYQKNVAFKQAAGTRMMAATTVMLLALGFLISPVFGASLLTAPNGQTSSMSASSMATTAAPLATLKLKSFSASGTGVLTSDNSGTTCFGETCNASAGNCECIVFNGTTKAPFVGKATWTAEYTVSDDDRTPTGNGGDCFPGEGELVITGAKATIAAELSGPICQNFIDASGLILQNGQAFQIDPALSTGTAAGLNGGGSFSLSSSLVSGGITTMTASGFSAR